MVADDETMPLGAARAVIRQEQLVATCASHGHAPTVSNYLGTETRCACGKFRNRTAVPVVPSTGETTE